jgi:hypothetical protein
VPIKAFVPFNRTSPKPFIVISSSVPAMFVNFNIGALYDAVSNDKLVAVVKLVIAVSLFLMTSPM